MFIWAFLFLAHRRLSIQLSKCDPVGRLSPSRQRRLLQRVWSDEYAMRKKVTQPDTAAAPAAVFQQKAIRRTLHNGEWWFVITDIVAALTDAADPSDYWKKMRRRDPDLGLDSQGGGQIDPPLALAFDTAGGRQKLQCWNTQGIFRLIQSIPSPKAEPFKRWLAKVGKERLDEIENPELAMGRMQELYEKKGYPKEWITKC